MYKTSREVVSLLFPPLFPFSELEGTAELYQLLLTVIPQILGEADLISLQEMRNPNAAKQILGLLK